MKLIFKFLIVFTSLNAIAVQPKMILVSGQPTPELQKLLEKTLAQNLPQWRELVHFDQNNTNCQRDKNAVIQFCVEDDDFYLGHQDEKVVKRTLGRLMEMNDMQAAQIQKAFQGKAQ